MNVVVLIKDLQVKGANFVAKRVSVVKTSHSILITVRISNEW